MPSLETSVFLLPVTSPHLASLVALPAHLSPLLFCLYLRQFSHLQLVLVNPLIL